MSALLMSCQPSRSLNASSSSTAAVALEQRAHDLRDAGVDDGLSAFLAALGGVVEDNQVTGDCDVLAQHRGQAVGAVVLGVGLAADAEEAEVQQAEGGSEHAPLGQASPAEMLVDGLARLRQLARERQDAVVLGSVTLDAPVVVVAVLPAPRRVGAECLDVALRERTDPYVLPGGWEDQRPDALEGLGVDDLAAVRVDIAEASAAPDAPDAGA